MSQVTGDDDVDLSDCIGAGTRTETILTISLVPETKSVRGTSKILFLKSDEWRIDMPSVLQMRQHINYPEERVLFGDCKVISNLHCDSQREDLNQLASLSV